MIETPLFPARRPAWRLPATARSLPPSLLTAIPLLLFACAARVDGPQITVTSVDQPLVCIGAATTVNIVGTGLGPLPIATLAGAAPKLAFPRVSVTNVSDLTGKAIDMPMAAKVADDPDHPEASHVHWTSSTALGFDITSALGLVPGNYSVSVTTPATPDVQTVSLGSAFLAVPAPTIAKLDVTSGCTDAEKTVRVIGAGFLVMTGPAAADGATVYNPVVKLLAPDGTTTRPDIVGTANCTDVVTKVPGISGVQTCTEVSFVLHKGTPVGAYKVSVAHPSIATMMPAPPACESALGMMPTTYTVTAAPTVTKVVPATVCATGGGKFTVVGTGFQKGAIVQVGGRTSSAAAVVVNGEKITVDFTVMPGTDEFTPVGSTFDVLVTNTDSCSATLPMAVTSVGGPTVYFVDAPMAAPSVSTPIALYASAISGAVTSVTLSKGAAMVNGMGMSDPKDPNRILATVPKGTAPGVYDVTIVDGTTCGSTIKGALTVAAAPTLKVSSVTPGIGSASAATAITINVDSGLVATPRVYLGPKAGGRATELLSVSFVSATQVMALVPAGLDPAAGPYDVAVVNPDGTSGLLAGGFIVNAKNLPRIDGVFPSAIPANSMQPIVIRGGDFRNSTVVFTCNDLGGTVTQPAKPTLTGLAFIQIAAPPLAMLPPGTQCTLRVTNGDDNSYVDYASFFITGLGGAPVVAKGSLGAGPAMNIARRAVGVAAAGTPNSRYLYAVGGDNGASAGALDSVESVSVNGAGPSGSFVVQSSKLLAKRTLAGVAGRGRYVYAVGGNDGNAPVATVERAVALDPAAASVVTDIDLKLVMAGGVPGGTWVYRIAAIYAMNDPENPAGESLPSAPVVVHVPTMMMGGVQVVLSFTAVTGATGYRIYRTPMVGTPTGTEILIDTVGAVSTWTDDGTKVPMGASPLPPGSLGNWKAMPALITARESPAVTIGVDPNDPGKLYLYAIGGRGANALATYEYLPIIVNNDGSHTVANGFVLGATPLATARYLSTASAGYSDIDSLIPVGTSLIYVVGGTTNGMASLGNVDVASIAAGGDLGAFSATGATFSAYGCSGVSAGNSLLSFGGSQMNAKSIGVGTLTGSGLTATGFVAASASSQVGRYLPGATIVGGAVLVVGGSDIGMNKATTSTEWMVY